MVRWSSVLIVVGVVIVLFTSGGYGNKKSGNRVQELRTDIVHVDAINRSEKKERPPVAFYHDLHTDALGGNKEGCGSCHTSFSQKRKQSDKLSVSGTFDFISADAAGKEQRMKAYHQKCIGCHTDLLSKNTDAGPLTCSGCHIENNKVKSSAVSGRFDKSLHQRHVDGLGKSCQSCHHQYDKVSKKLYYKKGREGSCSYCHLENPSNPNPTELTFKEASHLQCVVCHETRIKTGKKAGPVRCEECHDRSARQNVAKARHIDRLDMGQRDFTMMKNELNPMPGLMKNRMDWVPFDHKNHETKNQSCRVCHHKELKSCVSCHTVQGSPKGGNFNLEYVMHQSGSTRSCSGCHELKRKTADCNGCHSFDVNWVKDERKNCVQCHVANQLLPDEKAQAAAIIDAKIKANQICKDWKVPERIVISKLEKNYQPVVFPHKKIVNALCGKINKNRMSQYFHHEKSTLCMGCHHNSPATANPTACSNCHSGTDKTKGGKPGLLGAYHIQCMECHSEMKIRQPESCTACHKEKKKR